MLAVSVVTPSLAQSPNHVYELRVYHALPGKMDALRDRFATSTDKIFQRIGIHSLGYWITEDPKQNLLIYVVQHDSKEVGDKHWAAFNNDPEWKKVKAETETAGPLTEKIDSFYMDPTTFSLLK